MLYFICFTLSQQRRIVFNSVFYPKKRIAQETEHAKKRGKERGIIGADFEYVLKTGSHEPSKDKFDEIYKAWNYAIRGKTLDKRELRIIITFDKDGLLLITVIDLNLEIEE